MRYIFGHGPSNERNEFANQERAIDYLRHELPNQREFRYRTTYQHRNVGSILFAFGGILLAELIVADIENPSDDDIAAYAKTKSVYVIDEIRHFANTSVRAADVGLTNYQFGKVVPDDVYAQILASAGGFGEIRKRQR